MTERIKRVNELLKEQVSQILLREMNFDNVLVTITSVDASPDLSQAKIKITVLPTEKSEQALKSIEENIYSLQQALNKKLTMKHIPKLIFEIDQAEVKAQELEKVLEKLKKD